MGKAKEIVEGMSDNFEFLVSRTGLVRVRLKLDDYATNTDIVKSIWKLANNLPKDNTVVDELYAFVKQLNKEGTSEMQELANAIDTLQSSFGLKYVNLLKSKVSELQKKHGAEK
jgi:hypothetical protein